MSSRPLRRAVHAVLEREGGSPAARAVSLAIPVLIALSAVAIVLESMEPVGREFRPAFAWFERFVLGAFALEYLLRLWTCVEDPRYARPFAGRLRHALEPLALVDLLAILPAFFFGASNTLLLRVVRLLSRLLKLARYSMSLRRLVPALRASAPEIGFTLAAGAVALLIASSLMYWAEGDVQPEVFSSIPAAAWWAIATLTTVGYGDVAPVTGGGRLIAGLVAVVGVAVVALPAGILAAAFNEAARGPAKCPHCGEVLRNPDRDEPA